MNRDIEQEQKRLEDALLSQEETTAQEEILPAEEMTEELTEEMTEETIDELIAEYVEETPAEELPELEGTDEEILEALLQEQQPDTTRVFSGELKEEKRAPIWFPIVVLLIMAVITGYVVATLVRLFL